MKKLFLFHRTPPWETRPTTALSVFPSLSFVKSLPFWGEDVTEKRHIMSFPDLVKFNNERWNSASVNQNGAKCLSTRSVWSLEYIFVISRVFCLPYLFDNHRKGIKAFFACNQNNNQWTRLASLM